MIRGLGLPVRGGVRWRLGAALALLLVLSLQWVPAASAATIVLNNQASCEAIGGLYFGDCRWYTGNPDLTIAAVDTLQVAMNVSQGTTFTNNGTVAIQGSFEFATYSIASNSGTITVASGARLSNFQGPFVNSGTITVASGATIEVDATDGDFTNNGTITVACRATIIGTIKGTQPQYPADCIGPTVTVNQAQGQADPTTASPINFTAVFGEAVTGFAADDVALSGTAGATTAIVTQVAPNNGTTYNIAVSGMAASGTVIASVKAGAVQDTAGNPSSASTSTDNTVTYLYATQLDSVAGAATYGGATATLTTTVTTTPGGSPVAAGGTVTFTYNGNTYPATTNAAGVATTTAPLPPGTGAGAYAGAVQASYAANTDYTASQGSGPLVVAKADQTIAFALGGTRPIGSTFTVSATSTSGGTVAFTSTTPGVCTVSGTTVTPLALGPCTIAASQPGDANHNPAPGVTGTVQIVQLITTTVARGSATYGDTTATLTATVTSFGQPVPAGGQVRFTFRGAVVGTVATNAQGVATLVVPLPAGTQGGTYARQVLAEYLGADGYLPSTDTGPLVVARRILLVKPVDQTVVLKQPNPTSCTLQLANGSAFLPGDDWGSVSTANLRCIYSRNYPNSNASETVGKTYKISATGVASANYDLRFLQGTLTVVAATP